MSTMQTANHVSFESVPCQPGLELWVLIVSPDRESLVNDIANAAKAEQLTQRMLAKRYRADRNRRADGALIVRFTKP